TLSAEPLIVISKPCPQLCFLQDETPEQNFFVNRPCTDSFFQSPAGVAIEVSVGECVQSLVAYNARQVLKSIALGVQGALCYVEAGALDARRDSKNLVCQP